MTVQIEEDADPTFETVTPIVPDASTGQLNGANHAIANKVSTDPWTSDSSSSGTGDGWGDEHSNTAPKSNLRTVIFTSIQAISAVLILVLLGVDTLFLVAQAYGLLALTSLVTGILMLVWGEYDRQLDDSASNNTAASSPYWRSAWGNENWGTGNDWGEERNNPQKRIRLIVSGLALFLILFGVGLVSNIAAVFLFVILAAFFPLSYHAYAANTASKTPGYRYQMIYDAWYDSPLAKDFILLTDYPDAVKQNTEAVALDLYRNVFEHLQGKLFEYYSKPEFWAYVALNILLTGIGIVLLFMPSGEQNFLTINLLSSVRLGFFGSYLFSVQLIYRRYTTSDLRPDVYLYTALNMMGGLVFNLVAFIPIVKLTEVLQDNQLGAGLAMILAFALGYFPFLAIRWFDKVAHSTLSQESERAAQLALDRIDGMSPFHETRLHDMGIDNVQNLATTDLHDVLTRTNLRGQTLLDWVDQALLYMHLNPGKMQTFRDNKIRTATDFLDLYADIPQGSSNGQVQSNPQTDLIAQLDSNPQQLNLLRRALSQGPNIHKVQLYWQNKACEDVILSAFAKRRGLEIQKETDEVKRQQAEHERQQNAETQRQEALRDQQQQT